MEPTTDTERTGWTDKRPMEHGLLQKPRMCCRVAAKPRSETAHGQPGDGPDNRQRRDDRRGLAIAVVGQTLRKEPSDLGQDNDELLGAERADFLEDERRVHREQLRRLHDRFLWECPIAAIVLVNGERTLRPAR
jgi:hypothetical protein